MSSSVELAKSRGGVLEAYACDVGRETFVERGKRLGKCFDNADECVVLACRGYDRIALGVELAVDKEAVYESFKLPASRAALDGEGHAKLKFLCKRESGIVFIKVGFCQHRDHLAAVGKKLFRECDIVLGRLASAILEENDYEMLTVINKYRPLTPDVESTVEVLREIEAASRIPFTGIVNNSNLGEETAPEDVLASLQYAEDVASAMGIPVVMTTVKADLYEELAGKIPNLFPLRLQRKIL